MRNEGETQRGGPPSGLGGGNAGGAGAGVNVNWDGSWEVKTQVNATGWTAEFAIPLRTLRYGPPPQIWGVNFSRAIEHKRESVYWSPVSRIYNLTRLSSAGELRDMNVPAPRDFKLMPYLTSSANRNFASTTEADYDQRGDWGLDGKIGVTSSATLDLTYNTDFAQVEVDEQQINLTRFNLFFPEKRDFFLEGLGVFAFAGRQSAGLGAGTGDTPYLFFSRRIGLDANSVIPLRAGGRLTGRVGKFTLGLLNVETGEEADVHVEPANFTVIRAKRDVLRALETTID